MGLRQAPRHDVEDGAGEVTFVTDRRRMVVQGVDAISEEGSPWRPTMFSFFETYSNVYMPNVMSRVLIGGAANTNMRRPAGPRMATVAADTVRQHCHSRALRPSCRPGMWGDPL